MSQENIYVIIFLIIWSIMSIVVLIPIILCIIRSNKYWRPPSSESREKMKFVTQLSKDEVLERLISHKINDIFQYEFKRESDIVFILWIQGIEQLKLYCKGNVKYKVVIIEKPENTVLWLVIAESDNDNAVERYYWELKGFMEKKIMAVRVE